ncbi:MAG: T9SS type A sorting domain-containing protein [Saprospirales bacterium]|nr:T9SS type A sorting domain-containing protein [Saprospirales bacterium]
MNLFNIKIIPILLFGLGIPFWTMGQVEMPSSVLGNGGGIMADAQYQLNGTLAQPFIGIVENASNQQYIGFWYQSRKLLSSVVWVEANTDSRVFSLDQNFPNPANSFTTIPFTVPSAAEVRLVVVNSSGKMVGRLVEGTFIPGVYQVEFDVTQLPPGFYFYQLYADGVLQGGRKMVVIQ